MNRAAKVAVIAAGLALAAACQDPPLTINFRLANDGGGQTCGTASCLDIAMPCRSVLSLRVLSPRRPQFPYIPICQEIATNANQDLCAIANIDLPPVTLPRETLEIQVTVWPREAVLDEDGQLDCLRTPVEFDDVYGFPTTPGPAFGGRTFYTPGDSETVVTLGCTNAKLVAAPTCSGTANLEVQATVLDFENLPLSVSDVTGDELSLAVGEPVDGVLSSAALHALGRTSRGPIPTWGAGVDAALNTHACLQVLEDVAQATATVRCRAVESTERRLDIVGVRVPKTTLDQVLFALNEASFPQDGMTLGMVIDQNGNPVAGVQVITNPPATIEYVSSDRKSVGGTSTSTSGIFVSRDAMFPTEFSLDLTSTVQTAIGGRVRGKLTAVHFDPADIQ